MNNHYDDIGFDPPEFLLGKVFPLMGEDEIKNWCIEEANALSYDLKKDGIDVNPSEIYELIAEYIAQDA